MSFTQSRLILIFALLFIYASSQDCNIVHCTTCLNDTHCETCDSGYIVNEEYDQCLISCLPEDILQLQQCLCEPTQVNQGGICYICEVDHCVLCGNTKTTCDFCETGYALNQDSTQCVKECSGTLGQCECLPSQISSGGSCVQCGVSNCLLCSFDDSTSCDFCQDGYLLIQGSDSKNTCQKCAVSNCKTCVDGTISECDQCYSGFQLVDNICQKKITCTAPQYFDGVQCVCPYGLYISGQQCLDCLDHCYDCADGSSCIECQKGYYLQNNECLSCPTNCQQCNNPTTCQDCYDGFEVGVSGTCQAKRSGIPGSVTVSVINTNGDEVTVGATCSGSCLSCQKSTICEKCVNNFYLSKGKCKKCKNKDCSTCEENNPNVCTSCEVGKELMNGKCINCPDSCIQCSQEDYCGLCDLRYYVDDQGQCSSCKDNCLVCSSSSDCYLCSPGYTIINNQCVQCLAGCSFCDQTLSCQGCNEGFFLNSEDLCQVCPTGCLTCSASDTCQTCLDGYELDTEDNMCYLVCEFPCYTCNKNKPTECLSCFAGYILSSNTNSCTVDLSCIDTKDCNFCPQDYSLITNDEGRICSKCSVSDQHCMGCDQDLTTCNLCETEYYLNVDNICSACASQCQTCDNAESCLKCKAGYYMVQIKKQPTGQCRACSKDHFCQTCLESNDECHSCLPGFHLDGHKCISFYMIKFRLLLEGNLDADFMQKYKGFRLNFVNSIGGYYTNKEYLLTGKAIKQGSVDYEFTMSIPENDTREDVKNTANMVASQGQIYNGIKIISSTVEPNFQDEPLDPEEGDDTTTEEGTNLGLVLGLSIPLALIALIVLFLLMRKSPKHSQFESDNVISAGKLTNVSDI